MKFGRDRRYKITAFNGNETWRNRSKIMWKRYWEKYFCDNWIYLTIDTRSEKTFLVLDCTFRIMEKYKIYETYKVTPNTDTAAVKYFIERKIDKILKSYKRESEPTSATICNAIDKQEEFIKWRNEKSRDIIVKIIEMNNLKLIRCCAVIGVKREAKDKVERFLQDLNGRFKELNAKIEKRFWGYGISLDTTILYQDEDGKYTDEEGTRTIYHDIFPIIIFKAKEPMFTISNKRTKKKVRLIKASKYKEKSEGFKM
jgi:hypothetical protein